MRINGGKRYKIIIGFFLLLFLLILISNNSIVGYVISDEVVETRIEKDSSKLEIKEPSKFMGEVRSFNKNKRMDFELEEGMIRIYFDLLNHSDFVEEINKNKGVLNENPENLSEKLKEIADSSVAPAEDFDIKVEEDTKEEQKYKWGYYIQLNELNFSAKIDVTSSLTIKIINDSTLQIGRSIISFSDLEGQGYNVKIGLPEIEFIPEELNITKEENLTELTDNSSELEEDYNFTEEKENVTANETGIGFLENLTEEENLTELTENLSAEEPSNITEEGNMENLSLDSVEELLPDEETEENSLEEDNTSEDLEENFTEESNGGEEVSNEGDITGSVIKFISGVTSRVVEEVKGPKEELFYENIVTVYIERDFSSEETEIGQIIELDPTFEIIEITKAEHLDENYTFLEDVYESVKGLDGSYVLIPNGEYLRVTFEENLTNEKDITIYARSNDSGNVKVYEKDNNETLAVFDNIYEGGEYKIYLTELEGEQDTFDLRSFGDIEYDYVIDPPIEINSVEDLNETRNNLSASYILLRDLNFSDCDSYENCDNMEAFTTGAGWLPIATFTGTFDGQNHTISNLYTNRSGTDYQGLFGRINGGSVSNLGVIDCDVTGKADVGAILGNGYNNVSIANCWSSGAITSTGGTAGGLVGSFYPSYISSITSSNSSCLVSSTGQWVGGLIGYLRSGNVTNSYFIGNISGTSYLGGLVGYANSNYASVYITNCWSSGNVSGSVETNGGFIGHSINIMVDSCYAKGNSSGTYYIGGFVGMSDGSNISNSYSTGSVTRISGTSTANGGFAGRNYVGRINKSYSTGSVHYEGTDDPTDKGFVGLDQGIDTNSFWDTESSGQSTGGGDAIGKTTAQMQNISTFTTASWNIAEKGDYVNETWFIDDGNDYPRLGWEFEEDMKPLIEFVPPTLEEGNVTSDDFIFVNVSASDIGRGNSNISTFIDFDNSLVGWWRMDDFNGTTVVDYTGSNNGTKQGDAKQTTAGKLGKGFEFDGDGDYVDVAGPSVSYTYSTISLWFKAINDGTDNYLFNLAGTGYPSAFIRWSDDDIVRVRWDSDGPNININGPVITEDTWNNLVVINNESGIFLYLNGQYGGSYYAFSGRPINLNTANIGSKSDNSQSFNGSIDDVMIFNRSLSAEEIQALYANQSTKYCFDNETEVMTDSGWKHFSNVSLEDEILTLNSNSGETEWQKPTEKQDFAHENEEMYRIETENYDEEKGSLLVSPEHKVYVAYSNKKEKRGSVSLVMMDKFGEDNNLSFYLENKDVTSNMDSLIVFKAPPQIFEMLKGIPIELGNLADFLLKSPKKSQIFFSKLDESIINKGSINIHDSQNALNSFKLFGLILPDFKSLETFSTESTTSLTRESLISLLSSSDISEISLSFFNNSNFLTSLSTSKNALLATEDQLIKSVLSISDFNSSGTDRVIVPILDLQSNYLSYLHTNKVFKPFGREELNNFNLIKISELYSEIEKGNKNTDNLVFLDEKGREIKIKNITKENYNGRIYDVTVPNHIILVKRGNLTVWSGNSYHNFTSLAEGTHTFKAYTQDMAGNVNETEMRTVTISGMDATPPSVTINSPLNQTYSYSTTSIVVNFTINEEGTCWFGNGTSNFSMDTTDNLVFNSTYSISSNNTYTIYAYCNDTAGNLNDTESVVFFVNSTPLIGLEVLYPTENINITQNEFFNVTLNVTCLEGNCETINTSLYSSGLIPINSGTPFYTNASSNPLTTSSLTEGQSETITFWVNATGEASNTHSFYAFANLTSNLDISNATGEWNLTIQSAEEGIAIYFSDKLNDKINWTISSLPIFNQSAEGNNGEGSTDYYINISTLSSGVDVYLKANSDLMTADLDTLGIGNETFSYSYDNQSVPSETKYSLTTDYDNKIGDNLGDGSVIYLKFFLSAPPAQPAGVYNNSLLFKAVPHGQTP
ncbi:MAG: LamG-like jellyroll fold domain-containing protein [Candidatus Pacearchaeota archaeon]